MIYKNSILTVDRKIEAFYKNLEKLIYAPFPSVSFCSAVLVRMVQ